MNVKIPIFIKVAPTTVGLSNRNGHGFLSCQFGKLSQKLLENMFCTTTITRKNLFKSLYNIFQNFVVVHDMKNISLISVSVKQIYYTQPYLRCNKFNQHNFRLATSLLLSKPSLLPLANLLRPKNNPQPKHMPYRSYWY